MCRVCQQSPSCASLMSQMLYLQSVSLQVRGYRHTTDVGTPSALTPADLPLDERDLLPWKITQSLHLCQGKGRLQGNLQLVLSSSARAVRSTALKRELGKKPKGEDVGSCDVC